MSASDCANVIVFQSSNNLYTWGASARNVSTGNVGLTIANDKYNRIYTKGLITISIPVKPADARSYIDVTFDVQNRKFGRRDIRHFTTSVERNKMFRMTFSLLDAESTATLLLVLKKDTYSRVNDFFGEPDSGPPAALYLLDFGHRRRTMIVSTMSLIGFTSSVTETNNTTVIVSGIVTHGPPTSRLFIGLLPAFYDSDQCQSCEKESTSCGFCHKMVNLKSIRGSPQHVHLAVSTRMLDCLYWNSLREVWTNTACKVYLEANPGYIVCECRHLSSFAGNMLVAPNKVDLFDLKMFLGVFQNPLVVSLLIAFWCMFMIATVWARRKDGKDSVKANMVVLMDNEDKSDYYYLVTVLTGWINGGGTTSAVAFFIAGNGACTKTHVIYDPDKHYFETGSENWFLLATKKSLGDLKRLTVWHSSKGLFPSWYLNQITVRDVQTNEFWHFVCNDWLTPARGIRSIRRSLVVDNSIKFSYRFKLKASQTIRDQHLWLSIFLRPAHSFFTRVQRVACAMSFIMVSMVTNIIWHGHAKSDDDIDIVHHSITIKWEHIVIGLQSLAITMACNGVAIWLFRNDRPRIIYTGSRLPLSRLHSNHAVDDTHNHQDHQLQPMTKKLKHRHVWLYYVAWFLTVSSSVVATFVTAEYSLTYGYSASVKWAISFFSTFIENIIILQPLKVSALAAVVSYFFGSKAGPASPADYYVKLANDKEYVSAMERVHNFRRLPSKHMYQLPEPIVIERASRSLVKVEKMWHTLHDTVIAVSLLALVFIIAYGSTNRWSFYINKSIQDTFVKGRYSKDIGLTEVQTYNDVWWYAKYTLLPSFHHNGTTYLSDEANILIGSAIIRQIRVDPNSQRYKAPPNPSSQKSYDSHAEDQTSYRRTWKKPIRQDSVTNPYSAWTYQSADTLQMGPITCRHRTYQGSGYVVVIRANRKRMMRLFQDLEDEQWLNTNTRAVLVQFTTFNPTTSLFTISLLAFEFTNVGVVEPYHDIKTCGLYSWTNKRDVFTIICEICCLLLTILYINRAFRRFLSVRRHLRQYFLSVWTCVDWVIIMLMFAAVSVFVLRVININYGVKTALKLKKRHVSFYDAVFYETIFTNILAATIATFVLKTFNLLYVSKRALFQTTTLKWNMKYISIFAAIIVLTFTLVAVGVTSVYGASCRNYSSLSTSSMNTINLLLFKLSIHDMGCIMKTDIVDFVFHIVVIVVLLPCVILSIFALTVLTASRSFHSSHIQEITDYFDFVLSRLMLMLGFWTLNEYSDHMKSVKH